MVRGFRLSHDATTGAMRLLGSFAKKARSRATRLCRRSAAAIGKLVNLLANRDSSQALDDSRFRIPTDLMRKELLPKKVLLIGSCLMEPWRRVVSLKYPDVDVEHITFNNASLLPRIDAAAAAFIDFQLLQIPLRSLLPEAHYFQLRYSDHAAYENLFRSACSRLEMNLSAILDYNKEFGVLSFVLNFPVPQQNPMGRLLSRYSLNNYVFFVEELNRHLNELVRGYTNVHVIDLDQILSTFGRKYFQDDSFNLTSHASLLHSVDEPENSDRLEPVGDFKALYTPRPNTIILAAFDEALACYRSLRQHDSIKLVIFDLDDTLWRGVLAEADDVSPVNAEGWPLSIVEALTNLWRRGILLAIASKNDEKTAERIWNRLYGNKFSFENFVVRKINWQPKTENIRDILTAVNLLPQNVLFIDDNPVERAAVKAAFPDMRVMDAPLVTWRRILLWSAELQPPILTDESMARTDMVKGQIKRDTEMATLDREAFLATLNLQVQIFEIHQSSDKRFARSHELLNKTNQFNTTGVRWSLSDLEGLFARSGYILAADVTDKYTAYGIVGVLLVEGNVITQFVMSCRVFGLGVEARCIDFARSMIARAGHPTVDACLVKTDKNGLALDLYEKSGFRLKEDGLWSIAVVPGTAAAERPKNTAPIPSIDGAATEFFFAPGEFCGKPAEDGGGAILLDSRVTTRGQVVYGPYVPVPAGSYEVTFLFKGKNASRRKVSLDVEIYGEKSGVVRSASQAVPRGGQARDISFPFDLKPNSDVFEFRIGASDFTGCAFRFDGVALRRVASRRDATVR